MVIRRMFAGLVIVVGVALAGCSSAAPTSSPSAAPTPTVALPAPTAAATATAEPTGTPSPTPTVHNGPSTTGTLPAELTGTFAARISRADVDEPDQAGDWFLTLTAADGYKLGRVASGVVENVGDLTVDGDHLRFSNEQGIGACPGTGEFTWSADGSNLTLTLVHDGCAARVNQNVSQPWVRCPARADTCRDVLH